MRLTISFLLMTFCLAGCFYHRESRCYCETRKFSVTSEPSDAEVYVIEPLSDKQICFGKTPLYNQSTAVPTVVEAENTAPDFLKKLAGSVNMIRVRIHKEGYKDTITNIPAKADGVASTHIILEKE